MSQPTDLPAPEAPKPDAAATGAKIALVGTIAAAAIGAAATIAVALLQGKGPAPAPPGTVVSASASPSPSISSRVAAMPPSSLARSPGSPALVAPAEVTYSCEGSAPDGVDISYGSDSSQYSPSGLPFTHTGPLDPRAQFYFTTAQLKGAGSVSCTTVVQTANENGAANRATAIAHVVGGYNIARAQDC
jgi:hypothetical protein